jgi:hypothetical protein
MPNSTLANRGRGRCCVGGTDVSNSAPSRRESTANLTSCPNLRPSRRFDLSRNRLPPASLRETRPLFSDGAGAVLSIMTLNNSSIGISHAAPAISDIGLPQRDVRSGRLRLGNGVLRPARFPERCPRSKGLAADLYLDGCHRPLFDRGGRGGQFCSPMNAAAMGGITANRQCRSVLWHPRLAQPGEKSSFV